MRILSRLIFVLNNGLSVLFVLSSSLLLSPPHIALASVIHVISLSLSPRSNRAPYSISRPVLTDVLLRRHHPPPPRCPPCPCGPACPLLLVRPVLVALLLLLVRPVASTVFKLETEFVNN